MTEMSSVRPRVAHRIWQGKSEERLAILPPESVDLILTDPPFGVDNQSNMSRTAEGKEIAQKIANDGDFEEAAATFKRVMDVLLPKTKKDCDMYVFTSDAVLMEWLQLMRGWVQEQHGFVFTRTLIWRKGGEVWENSGQTPGMGNLDTWGSGVEFILYAKKGNKPRFADRRGAVIDCPKIPSKELIHPHQKPTRLLQQLIEFSTQEGDLVVDPFCGSGATVRAAHQANRSCITVEYSEKHYRRALEKFQTDTVSII